MAKENNTQRTKTISLKNTLIIGIILSIAGLLISRSLSTAVGDLIFILGNVVIIVWLIEGIKYLITRKK